MLKLICLLFTMAVCMLAIGAPGASAASWTIQTTPNATGAEHSNLYDISCTPATTTNPCVSVGKLTESGGKTAPYAQAWNGTSWTNVTAKAPEGATAGELQSADCFLLLESMLCYAAGSYTSSGVTKSLILSGGTGGFSTIQTTPNPEGASETVLKGMTCRVFSSTSCMAVGYSVKSGKKTAFALRMSESKWIIQAMPEPEGAISSELHGIDCPTTTFCFAVGSYSLSAAEPQWAWSATWNGSTWTLRAVAKPTGSVRSTLLDIYCAESTYCKGVGAYRNATTQFSFIAHWNGSAWSHEFSPNPASSTNTVLQGVSCPSGAPCVAVGDWYNGKSWQPMAQGLSGIWMLDTTPNPAGATETIIEGVACRQQARCLSVGWYKDSGGKMKTLGESRP